MNLKIEIGLAMVVACLLTLAGLNSMGIAAHVAGKADKSWARQAEELFYLSPGTGEKVLSRSQWDEYKEKIANMDPERLASFRLETHMALMGSFHDRHPVSPTLVPNQGTQADVKFNPGMKLFLKPIAARAAAGSGSSPTGARAAATGAIPAASGANPSGAASLGGSTPVTGTSGAASGSIGGTGALVGIPTPTTGTSGTASGSIGGTAALGSFNPSPFAPTAPAATAGAGSSAQSLTAATQAAPATAPSLTAVSPAALGSTAATSALEGSVPVTGSSGTLSGAPGGTAALGGFTGAPGTTAIAGSGTTSTAQSPTAVTGTAGVIASTNLSTLGAALPQTATMGSGSVPMQGAAECAAPVQMSAPAAINGVVTSRDADRMFGVDPTTSTKRSVDSYDDSRGAIFHRDFDIGGGNRDMDRNYW